MLRVCRLSSHSLARSTQKDHRHDVKAAKTVLVEFKNTKAALSTRERRQHKKQRTVKRREHWLVFFPKQITWIECEVLHPEMRFQPLRMNASNEPRFHKQPSSLR